MGIQSSINTALGVAAIASGLTNKKQVDKAQDKLDKSEEKLAKTTAEKEDTEGKLANTKEDLAKTTEEKKQQAKTLSALKDEENIKYGKNTYNASNDLPTAKETNIDNAGDKSVSNNSINPFIASWMKDYLNTNKKVDPYTFEQFMGSHALKMSDSMVAAKRAVEERIKGRMDMISPQAAAERARLEREKSGTYSTKLNLQTLRALKDKEDGTYSFRNGKLVKEKLESGYQVSFFRPEITDENIQSALKKFGNKLGPAYLGLFEGSPEISYSFKDKDKAMEFAQAFNQYSIWDNKKGEQILNDKYNESAKVDYNNALDKFGGNK